MKGVDAGAIARAVRGNRRASEGALGRASRSAVRAARLAALRAWKRAPAPATAAGSDAVGDQPHHVRRDAHQAFHRERQLGGAGGLRRRAVARLVVAHLLDDGAALRIGGGQALHVRRQVLLDLALGFDDEAQIDAIAGDARGDADRERARIPERIEPRRAIVELREALLRPREVFLLLARGRGELAPDARIDARARACAA